MSEISGVTLELGYNGKLSLPVHYNYQVQDFLCWNITEELGAFSHNEGFVYGKRRFKMFIHILEDAG